MKKILKNKTYAKKLHNIGRLSAIWILSCNDPIAIMSYDFIEKRLAIPKKEAEELIDQHSALISKEVPKLWLEEWRDMMYCEISYKDYQNGISITIEKHKITEAQMKKYEKRFVIFEGEPNKSALVGIEPINKGDNNHHYELRTTVLPTRIRKSVEENKKSIDEFKKFDEEIQKFSIKETDYFSSQFRMSPFAPTSPIEITKWGLDYIENFRKSELEISETNKRWFKEYLPVFLSAFITGFTIIAIYYFNNANIKIQENMKNDELEIQRKNSNTQADELKLRRDEFEFQKKLKENQNSIKSK